MPYRRSLLMAATLGLMTGALPASAQSTCPEGVAPSLCPPPTLQAPISPGTATPESLLPIIHEVFRGLGCQVQGEAGAEAFITGIAAALGISVDEATRRDSPWKRLLDTAFERLFDDGILVESRADETLTYVNCTPAGDIPDQTGPSSPQNKTISGTETATIKTSSTRPSRQ